MFKGNQFSRDTHEEHLQRCQLCAIGVVTYDGELSFRPSWKADITAHAPNFEALMNEQNIQDAEWRGAVTSLETARNNLYEYNSSARWMVKAILDDPLMDSGVLRLIGDAFDIDGDLTKGFFNLTENTRKLLNGQTKLVDLGAPWTLPAVMVAKLTYGLTVVESFADTAEDEHGEKLKATDDIYTARTFGENLLRNIFRWVVANWGDDDPRMLEFGFVPKSQIWTPGTPEPGTPEWPGPAEFEANYLGEKIVELVYGPVADAVKGAIRRRKTGNMNWSIVAEGLLMDENRVPFRDTDVPPAEYEYEFVCYNNANEPSEAAYATMVVPEAGNARR